MDIFLYFHILYIKELIRRLRFEISTTPAGEVIGFSHSSVSEGRCILYAAQLKLNVSLSVSVSEQQFESGLFQQPSSV